MVCLVTVQIIISNYNADIIIFDIDMTAHVSFGNIPLLS